MNHFVRSSLAGVVLLLSACGTATPDKGALKVSEKTGIHRTEFLTVTCGEQIQAAGSGAAPNEVVKVRIREQIEGGIDLTREVVADDTGNFVVNDFCDPESPNAEVSALWSYEGSTSGRTGEDVIQYRLKQSDASPSTT